MQIATDANGRWLKVSSPRLIPSDRTSRASDTGIFLLHYAPLTAHEVSIMPTPHLPPLAVRKVLSKLGSDIHDARKRRNLPAEVVAAHAFTSRPTLRRIESGDSAVSIGIYAAVLQSLGLLGALEHVADASRDSVGMALAADKLPKRARLKRKVKA
jgi:hypothetical protein